MLVIAGRLPFFEQFEVFPPNRYQVRCPAVAGQNKNPALVVCHYAIEPLQHAGRLDGFRRPVKVSAAIAAFVPYRLIPIQGLSSQSRTGQGKFAAVSQRTLPFYAT